MCGIFFTNSPDEISIAKFDKLAHRGPDGSQCLFRQINGTKYMYGFHRLSIINPSLGINQPLQHNNVIVLCNGEIYNWQKLAKLFDIHVQNDAEIVIRLYFIFNRDFTKLVQWLDGEFSIILHDLDQGVVFAARDILGARGLYYSYTDGKLEIASELKALTNKANHIEPRQIYKFTNKLEISPYWQFPEEPNLFDLGLDQIYDNMYKMLSASVEIRLHADQPIGALLSGGLDSSLIVALAAKYCPNIQCFVVGGPDSPDVIAANKVAEYLRVPLQVVPFDFKEGIKSIPNVIQSLETYDITTIRASTPQWHLARWISQNTDIKVILSGEISDELYNGYLYTKLYDDPYELWHESERVLSELHMFDALRTDRAISSWGLEVRVPFLNKALIEYVRRLDPKLLLSNPIEKALLRNMAAKYKLLPDEIIWRKKEAFSDAVSFSWKDVLAKHAEEYKVQERDHLTAISPEAEWYRQEFDRQFPGQSHILPHYWLPKKFATNDPSARILPVYETK